MSDISMVSTVGYSLINALYSFFVILAVLEQVIPYSYFKKYY